MRRTPSLAGRLTLALSLAVGLAWLAAAAAGAWVIRRELSEALDGALQETAQRLLPLALDTLIVLEAGGEEEQGPAQRIRRAARVAAHGERVVYQLRDAAGRVLLRSHEAPNTPFPAPLARGFAEAEGLRVYTEPAISETLFLQVAEPLAHRRDAAAWATFLLVAPLVPLLPILVSLARRVVRRALGPVDALAAEIAARDEHRLEPVGRSDLPRELAPIATSVDRLLARLGRALASERAFARAGAHELRTPLAGALAQAQQLLAELGPGPQRERVARIEAALSRLRRLVEQVLDLARAERPTSRPETAVPLGPVLGLVLEDLGRAGLPVERIAIAGDPGTLAARIDPDGFALILRNLLENALRHGDPAAPVALDIEPPGRITIRNGGPPLPPGLLADPPAAAAAGSAGGAGLGLLIARTAARASGSRLELVSPIPGTGGGVEARLDLPG
ncbi:MAG: HAMP domain-containing histidine kinase [Geminicoccaceae bacterium]|nr:HAMP domain-containing histidine kinase [Geminicoccaceae bacterium]